MQVEKIKEYCLSKHKACETYPFGDVPICYKLNGKVFAQIYPYEWDYKITLKCTADAGEFYRGLDEKFIENPSLRNASIFAGV